MFDKDEDESSAVVVEVPSLVTAERSGLAMIDASCEFDICSQLDAADSVRITLSDSVVLFIAYFRRGGPMYGVGIECARVA